MPKFASGKTLTLYQTGRACDIGIGTCVENGTDFFVGKDEFENKHPQLGPFRSPVDAQALRDARPFNDSRPVTITFPAFNLSTVQYIPVPKMHAQAGTLTTSDTVTVAPISVTLTGVSRFDIFGHSYNTGQCSSHTDGSFCNCFAWDFVGKCFYHNNLYGNSRLVLWGQINTILTGFVRRHLP